MVWSYKGVVGNVCVNQHTHLCMCVSVYFVHSQRGLRARRQVREKERERKNETVNHAEREKKVRER